MRLRSHSRVMLFDPSVWVSVSCRRSLSFGSSGLAIETPATQVRDERLFAGARGAAALDGIVALFPVVRALNRGQRQDETVGVLRKRARHIRMATLRPGENLGRVGIWKPGIAMSLPMMMCNRTGTSFSSTEISSRRS